MISSLRVLVLALLLLMPFSAGAQTPSESSSEQVLKPQQLDALVAPIALYPDTLLSQVLMASTYPLEVVQAERWAMEHKNLEGDRAQERGREAGLGRQREVARRDAIRSHHDEQEARLDTKIGRCRSGSAAGRHGCYPAVTIQGLCDRKAEIDQRTERHGQAGG